MNDLHSFPSTPAPQHPSTPTPYGRAKRLSVAAAAAALLVAGATWRAVAADSGGTAPQTVSAQAAPAVSRAVIGGRDSYADIVKAVGQERTANRLSTGDRGAIRALRRLHTNSG